MVLARKTKTQLPNKNLGGSGRSSCGEVEKMSEPWDDEDSNMTEKPTAAKAMFIPQPNSLPFEERCVSLDGPVRIGRNVSRLTPSPTNTIFECRVLSRHHATLWYENEHFFINDNNSSNGTFINHSKTSICDMGSQEVFSGDIVQFGIAVSENHDENVKNMYLPVVAMLKLYHPNGEEAKQNMNTSLPSTVQLKELYQLNNFIQEAMQREAALEGKLQTLKLRLEATRECAWEAWRLLVGEQMLMVRVNALESSNRPISDLIEDKKSYQIMAQERLSKAHEKRLELEESLERKTREAETLRQQNATLKQSTERALSELQKLAGKCEHRMNAAREAVLAAEQRESATYERLQAVLAAFENRNPKEFQLDIMYFKKIPTSNTGTKKDNKLNSTELKLQSNDIIQNIDDENKLRLNHDGEVMETDGTNKTDSAKSSSSPDDNANSTTYRNDVQETKSNQEIANAMRVISALNREITELKERLKIIECENEKLHAVRDELLSSHIDISLEMQNNIVQDNDKNNECAEVKYKEFISDLQKVLDATIEQNNEQQVIINNLKTQLTEATDELERRPTEDNFKELSQTIETLKTISTARTRSDACVSTEDEEEESTSEAVVEAELEESIDKLFDEATKNHEFGDDDGDFDDMELHTTLFAGSTISRETLVPTLLESQSEHNTAQLEEECKLAERLENGSCHILQEELIKAKESWASLAAEKAALEVELMRIKSETGLKQRVLGNPLVIYSLPVIVAALLYILMYQFVS